MLKWPLSICYLTLACFAACLDVDGLSDGVCDEGQKACEGECVRLDRVEFGCAADSCQPCVVPNARPICSHTGECTISICNGGFTDCNRDPEDGCEVETDFDVDNCGQCGRECPPGDNYEPACSGGACAVGICDPPFANCNGITADACEVNVATDNEHCGRCLNPCGAGMVCNGDEDNPECIPE